MIVFLQSLRSRIAKEVTKPFSVPDSDEATWFKIVTKKFDANAKGYYALLQVLNDDDITRVIHCKSARGLHKSRELRLISCVSNLKFFL